MVFLVEIEFNCTAPRLTAVAALSVVAKLSLLPQSLDMLCFFHEIDENRKVYESR